MEDELRPSERIAGTVGGLAALFFLFFTVAGGPGAGCPTSTPATGLCAMDWSFQVASGQLRVAYALAAFAILVVGAILITRRSARSVPPSRPSPAERRLGAAVVGLALLGVALLVATVAIGFLVPPTMTVTFTNGQLPSVGNLYEQYYGTERAATVYLTAGETITVTFRVAWYANGSTTIAGYGGSGYDFPPSIEPEGQPYNYTGPWATWYVVPRTGSYTIYIEARYPGFQTPYTSNATMTVTAYNVAYYPAIQLPLESLGGISFAAAVVVDWLLHPRWAGRSARDATEEPGPPQA